MLRLYLETILPFFAVFIFSLVAFLSDPGVQQWLGLVNWNAVREWLSALSGWVAAIAAFGTIYVVIKQIRQASEHHKEAIGIQQRELYNISEKTQAVLNACRALSTPLEDAYCSLEEEDFRRNYPQMFAVITELSEWFDDETIDEFERRIWIDRRNDLIGIRRQIDGSLESFRDWQDHRQYLLSKLVIQTISRRVTVYCDAALSAAAAFSQKYSAMYLEN